MTLWTCTTCGCVLTERGMVSIAEEKIQDNGDTLESEHYIEEGVCPCCGGRGVIVEKVDVAERNN